MTPGFQRTPGHLIRQAHQYHNTIFAQETKGLDITAPQFAALRALSEFPDIDQTTLARLISNDRATIGGLVERLEGKGLLRRAIDKRDGRARTLRLTAAGKVMYARMRPMLDAVTEKLVAELTREERELFMSLLERVLQTGRQYAAPEIARAG